MNSDVTYILLIYWWGDWSQDVKNDPVGAVLLLKCLDWICIVNLFVMLLVECWFILIFYKQNYLKFLFLFFFFFVIISFGFVLICLWASPQKIRGLIFMLLLQGFGLSEGDGWSPSSDETILQSSSSIFSVSCSVDWLSPSWRPWFT